MLTKQFRLTKNREFKNVWQRGRGCFLQELGIKAVKNKLGFSRFGFIVSTKISKKAVVRNKIKRRLREIIRKRIKKIENGFDFVFITRPGIEKLTYQELEKRIEEILTKMKMTSTPLSLLAPHLLKVD